MLHFISPVLAKFCFENSMGNFTPSISEYSFHTQSLQLATFIRYNSRETPLNNGFAGFAVYVWVFGKDRDYNTDRSIGISPYSSLVSSSALWGSDDGTQLCETVFFFWALSRAIMFQRSTTFRNSVLIPSLGEIRRSTKSGGPLVADSNCS
jgi:hypothetical protein